MTVDNTNLFLQQLGKTFSQGTSYSGTTSSSSLGYSEIAWFSQALQDCGNMTSDDHNQKSDATADLVGLLFNAAFKFLSNAASSAQTDVQSSDANIQSTLSKYVTHRDKTTDSIDKILDEIENGDMKTIADALDKIEALGGDKGDLAEVKKQIEEKQEEITKCMDAVKEGQANGDSSKILTNLAKIEGLRGEAAELIKSVDSIMSQIAQQDVVVANATVSLNNHMDEAGAELNKEIEKTSENMSETTTEGVTNTQYVAQGPMETETGVALEAEADAASSNLITATAATALHQKASQYMQAGSTHLEGGSLNLAAVGTNLSSMGEGMATVASYAQTIGSVVSNALNLVGDYSAKSEALITSIGTYSGTVNQVMGDEGELANAVNTDLQSLVDFAGIEETVIDNISLENQGMSQDKATPKKSTNELLGQVAKNTKSYTGELTEDQQTQLKNLELETLKVDLSKLKA